MRHQNCETNVNAYSSRYTNCSNRRRLLAFLLPTVPTDKAEAGKSRSPQSRRTTTTTKGNLRPMMTKDIKATAAPTSKREKTVIEVPAKAIPSRATATKRTANTIRTMTPQIPHQTMIEKVTLVPPQRNHAKKQATRKGNPLPRRLNP